MADNGLVTAAVFGNYRGANMIDTQKIIRQTIVDDTGTIDLLGANEKFYEKGSEPSKENSIYPVGMAPFSAACPFITVQGGPIVKAGFKTLAETYYLRVYDKKERDYIRINTIAERLMDLFDEKIFALDNRVMVRAKYDSTLQEATDEAMSRNFREVRFRIVLI